MTRRIGEAGQAVAMVLVGVSVLLACGGGVWGPVPDIPQHVEYDTVKIEYGEDDGLEAVGEGEMETQQQLLVGDPSGLAQFTTATIATTNISIYGALRLIAEIKKLPYSDYDRGSETFVWEGENKEGYYFELTVKIRDTDRGGEALAESHTFALKMGESESNTHVIVDGEFDRFQGGGERQQGQGIVRLYFDNLRRYDASSPKGVMRMSFRSRNGVRQVRTGIFRSFLDTETESLNAIYRYEQYPDRQGRFRFFGRYNVNDTDVREFVAIATAWTRAGEGLAAVRATGGSLDDRTLLIRQCWDQAQDVTFMNTTPDRPEQEGGAVEDCAAPLQDLELEPPTYDDPAEADPDIPSPLPEEGA